MRLRTFSVVLLALLLAAMAMVPMVSADELQYSELQIENGASGISDGSTLKEDLRSNTISLEKARDYALDAFAECVYIKTMGDSIDWSEASLNPDPVIINNLNGDSIYYQFWVEKKGIRIGKIRIATNKIFGSPIKLVGTASPEEFDEEILETKVKKIAAEDFDGYSIISQTIVAYDNPTIGILAELFNTHTRDTKRIVVEAGFDDYVTLSENKISGSQDVVYEYLEFSKTQIKDNIAIFTKENTRIEKNLAKMNALGIIESQGSKKMSISKSQSREQADEMRSVIMSGLRFPNGVKILSPMSSTFQGYRDWCAVGAATAITDHYFMKGVIPSSRSLDTIATKMNIYGTTHGPTSDDEYQYYIDSWSNGGLGMSWGRAQRNPYFYEIKNSIDGGNPMKTVTASGHTNPNIPNGHARAAYGYDDRYTTKRVYYSDSMNPPAGSMYVEDYQPSLSFIYRN